MSKSRGNIFTHIQLPIIKSNRFDLSHDVKMSLDMGYLCPTMSMECMPGDKVRINVENMLRFAPLVAPVMHKINVTTHFFFVPNRILWSNWEDFITDNVEDLEHPYCLLDGLGQPGSLSDYLGYPRSSMASGQLRVNPFPIAAYAKIWDEYYRDQNLQDEIFVPLIDGENGDYNAMGAETPQRRAWMHDYFTSCLPFAQKGDSVTLPLTQTDAVDVTLKAPNTNFQLVRDQAGNLVTSGANLTSTAVTGALSDVAGGRVIDPNSTLEVDVNEEAVTINTLRRAFRLQEFLERAARGGTRYIEQILSQFGVYSSDKRLQRPEYIGGAKQNMVISEVLATAKTDADETVTPVGNMAGHGISVGRSKSFNYNCEEHGWIIGIINIQPVTAYYQGLHRSLSKVDRFDYPWPIFANIGEQEVLNKEVYAEDGTVGPDPGELNGTFGYIPRYSEYKYLNARVAGDMKTSLEFWHLGRKFTSTPELNEDFIECVPDKRIFAVTSTEIHSVYAHIFNNVSVIRKLPKFGVPTI